MTAKQYNEYTSAIIECAIKVHKELGPGLLINFNVSLLKNGIKRKIIGEL
jgi:hypothetical protein